MGWTGRITKLKSAVHSLLIVNREISCQNKVSISKQHKTRVVSYNTRKLFFFIQLLHLPWHESKTALHRVAFFPLFGPTVRPSHRRPLRSIAWIHNLCQFSKNALWQHSLEKVCTDFGRCGRAKLGNLIHHSSRSLPRHASYLFFF